MVFKNLFNHLMLYVENIFLKFLCLEYILSSYHFFLTTRDSQSMKQFIIHFIMYFNYNILSSVRVYVYIYVCI